MAIVEIEGVPQHVEIDAEPGTPEYSAGLLFAQQHFHVPVPQTGPPAPGTPAAAALVRGQNIAAPVGVEIPAAPPPYTGVGIPDAGNTLGATDAGTMDLVGAVPPVPPPGPAAPVAPPFPPQQQIRTMPPTAGGLVPEGPLPAAWQPPGTPLPGDPGAPTVSQVAQSHLAGLNAMPAPMANVPPMSTPEDYAAQVGRLPGVIGKGGLEAAGATAAGLVPAIKELPANIYHAVRDAIGMGPTPPPSADTTFGVGAKTSPTPGLGSVFGAGEKQAPTPPLPTGPLPGLGGEYPQPRAAPKVPDVGDFPGLQKYLEQKPELKELRESGLAGAGTAAAAGAAPYMVGGTAAGLVGLGAEALERARETPAAPGEDPATKARKDLLHAGVAAAVGSVLPKLARGAVPSVVAEIPGWKGALGRLGAGTAETAAVMGAAGAADAAIEGRPVVDILRAGVDQGVQGAAMGAVMGPLHMGKATQAADEATLARGRETLPPTPTVPDIERGMAPAPMPPKPVAEVDPIAQRAIDAEMATGQHDATPEEQGIAARVLSEYTRNVKIPEAAQPEAAAGPEAPEPGPTPEPGAAPDLAAEAARGERAGPGGAVAPGVGPEAVRVQGAEAQGPETELRPAADETEGLPLAETARGPENPPDAAPTEAGNDAGRPAVPDAAVGARGQVPEGVAGEHELAHLEAARDVRDKYVSNNPGDLEGRIPHDIQVAKAQRAYDDATWDKVTPRNVRDLRRFMVDRGLPPDVADASSQVAHGMLQKFADASGEPIEDVYKTLKFKPDGTIAGPDGQPLNQMAPTDEEFERLIQPGEVPSKGKQRANVMENDVERRHPRRDHRR